MACKHDSVNLHGKPWCDFLYVPGSLRSFVANLQKISWNQTLGLASLFRSGLSFKPDVIIWGDVALGGPDLADLLHVPHIKFSPGHAFEPMDNIMMLYRHEAAYIPAFSSGLPAWGMNFPEVCQKEIRLNISAF